jgi:hypothetical protein
MKIVVMHRIDESEIKLKNLLLLVLSLTFTNLFFMYLTESRR